MIDRVVHTLYTVHTTPYSVVCTQIIIMILYNHYNHDYGNTDQGRSARANKAARVPTHACVFHNLLVYIFHSLQSCELVSST